MTAEQKNPPARDEVDKDPLEHLQSGGSRSRFSHRWQDHTGHGDDEVDAEFRNDG